MIPRGESQVWILSVAARPPLGTQQTYDDELAAVEDDMADCWLAIGHSLHTDKQV